MNFWAITWFFYNLCHWQMEPSWVRTGSNKTSFFNTPDYGLPLASHRRLYGSDRACLNAYRQGRSLKKKLLMGTWKSIIYTRRHSLMCFITDRDINAFIWHMQEFLWWCWVFYHGTANRYNLCDWPMEPSWVRNRSNKIRFSNTQDYGVPLAMHGRLYGPTAPFFFVAL